MGRNKMDTLGKTMVDCHYDLNNNLIGLVSFWNCWCMSGCNKRPVHIKQPLKMTKKYAKNDHDMGFWMTKMQGFLRYCKNWHFFWCYLKSLQHSPKKITPTTKIPTKLSKELFEKVSNVMFSNLASEWYSGIIVSSSV